jgi:hypothetical protein
MAIAFRRAILAGCFLGSSLYAQGSKSPTRCAAVADFVELEGRDTITLSRVALTDSTFESTTHSVSQNALVRYTGRLSASGEPRSLHFEVWPRVADSAGPPAQIADVAIQGADVTARVASPTRGIQMQHDRLPSGGVLYMTGVPLFLEFVQRHVHLAVGATTAVPLLWLFTGGAVDTVQVVRPAADSLTVKFADIEYDIALAADHSILGAVSRPKTSTAGAPSRLIRRDCR